MKTISLFSSYGLGDLGLRAAGAEIALMAELLPERCRHLRRNFPEAEVVECNLDPEERSWEAVVGRAEALLGGEPPFLLVATPPCQGMSTNGAGKIARAVERGERPELDPRNRLIISALKIIERLKPKWVVFENVVQMKNTCITTTTTHPPVEEVEEEVEEEVVEEKEEVDGDTMPISTTTSTTSTSTTTSTTTIAPIVDIVRAELERMGYSGGEKSVDFSRHGVPQDRQRLITVYGLGGPHDIGSLLPPEEPGEPPTLRQAIGHLEALDARGRTSGADPLHRVKAMNENLHWWVSRIAAPGGTAYDNQCDRCDWDNPTRKGKQDGTCPAYCGGCGALLPRPTVPVSKGGERRRIIKGFRTAYKRMEWDRPAPTVTMNLMTPSSDNKLHPEQNRTLSPAEGAIIQTVDRYAPDWGADPSDREMCDALGEAVPPLFFERLLSHLAGLPA